MARLKITVEDTPNPHALKFTLGRPIAAPGVAVSTRPRSFVSAEQAVADPLASRLFALPGVTNVMYVNDFVTVNKSPATRWKALTPRIKAVLAEVLG